LSYSEPDLETAVCLKKDLEAFTGLFVTLENEDWEDFEDSELRDRIHQAEVLLNVETETSDIITAWLIDENKPYVWSRSKSRPKQISVAPTMDITNSYEAALETWLGYIAKFMDRNYPTHLSGDQDDSHDIDYEKKNPQHHCSREETTLSVSERAVGQAMWSTLEPAEAWKAISRPPLEEADVIAPNKRDGALNDIFAIPKKRTLGRTEALKARRQNRANRKSLLREARAQRLTRGD